jgi:phosphoribosylamine--glycine ligase
MRILVIGGGGREHALCWKLDRSRLCEALFCAPGNGGTGELAVNLALDVRDVAAVRSACKELRVSLVVVGPEQPLVDGLADRLRERGVAVFGPSAGAARLEGSKAWAKDFMARHGIPTAAARVFEDGAALRAHLADCDLPVVVKADGLAAGKGVIVCPDRQTARAAAIAMTVERRFGTAASRVLVEDFMAGEEATVLALLDGETVMPLPALQDHKRRLDGDRGPNTGGMGACTPVPSLDAATMDRVRREILEPAAHGLVAENLLYRGVLYAGLMLTPKGPKVVEFNVRFGDPECQPLMLAMQSDLLPLLDATARGQLAKAESPRFHDGASVCVVLVNREYPESAPKGRLISRVPARTLAGSKDSLPEGCEAVVFHAGTRQDPGGGLVADGGRILSVTARGPDFAAAREAAYSVARRMRWEGMEMRNDIGLRALGGASAGGVA